MAGQFETGYNPANLPFYTHPAMNDVRFEQFCTDLINLHPEFVVERDGKAKTLKALGASRLLSGTPQKGADIRVDVETGEVWFFQCKFTQAFHRSDVEKTTALAERSLPQADQFVLVTSCGLSEESLSVLKSKPKWLHWDGGRLTTELHRLKPREAARDLVHRYFDPDTAKKLFLSSDRLLVSWKEFFARDLASDDIAFHHRSHLITQGETLTKLVRFAESGNGRALVFSAGGGLGKSRLLLELARHLEDKPLFPRVRFLNLNRGGLDSEQRNFLKNEEDPLLLIIDDAHRLDDTIEDIARSVADIKCVRLLLATRPQAAAAIQTRLYRSGYTDERIESIEMPRWTQESLHALAEQQLTPENRLHAPVIAQLSDHCPLLVMLGAKLVNSGASPLAMKTQADFRERVFQDFKEEFLRTFDSAKRAQMERLIELLSFVSPTPRSDEFLTKAGEVLNRSAIDVAADIVELQSAGIVVENREGIRLYPDLFADAVLMNACCDEKGRPSFFHSTLLKKLPTEDFPALLRNVAQVDWEVGDRIGKRGEFFAPIWAQWLEQFKNGDWRSPLNNVDFTRWILQEKDTKKPYRTAMLSQWSSFAVYLPERTLDIAKLCVESVLPEFKQGTLESVAAWRTVSHSLPPLLKPIATWHPDFAESALDLLWKLEAEEPGANWQSDSNAIVAIAEVAAFSVRKPYRASEMVMKWLEKKVSTQAFIERLYEQPWILGALLKPFFGRTIENTWSTGRTVHIETKYVSAEKTRPLRQRALAIAEKLLNGSDSMLNHSVIPIIEKAIGPVWRKTGETTARDHEAWQPDRLHAVRLIETAGTLHANDPALLLRLRRILNGRCEHDPDAVIKNECVRVRAGLPDTFELRVMRAIGSWAHEEIIIRSEPEVTFRARWDEAEKEWHNFQREVAEEVCDRFGSAEQLCNFISKQLEQLTALKMTTLAGQVLEHVANKSPYWCSELLKQILYGDLTPLDGYVWPVINCARTVSPQEYDRAIKWLHTNGRPDQLFGVLRYFGWKFLHGGGLDQQERDCIMSIARRAEPAIVRAVANTSQIFFIEDPEWVLELLTQLKISDEPTGAAGLEALAHVVEKHSARLRAEDVSECLKKFGAFCLPETTSDEGNLDKVAQRFAKEVYEHVKNICERAETDPNVLHRGYFEPIDLGLIADDSYVDAEINQLWERSLGKEAFGQKFRLDLIRSMVWSDPARAVSRLTGLLRRAKNSEQLKWVVRIGAGEGSRFVFEYPDLVRVMLTMSVDFDAAEQIRTALLFSAQGVERSYTNHELDPEYRYILEQSEALANRFSGDATLHSFYEAIIGAENAERRWRKQVFSDQVD